jgi:hypothetical protein
VNNFSSRFYSLSSLIDNIKAQLFLHGAGTRQGIQMLLQTCKQVVLSSDVKKATIRLKFDNNYPIFMA